MKIELNPNVAEQYDAIGNRESLHIDNNISGGHFDIQSGIYSFDLTVGSNSGYLVDVIEN